MKFLLIGKCERRISLQINDIRRMAKGELYPDHADSASLILMGDWCSNADTERNEDLRCGEETATDVFKTQKDII